MSFWTTSTGFTLVPLARQTTRDEICKQFKDLRSKVRGQIHFLHNCQIFDLLRELGWPTQFLSKKSDYYISWLRGDLQASKLAISWNGCQLSWDNGRLALNGKEACKMCFWQGSVQQSCNLHSNKRSGTKRSMIAIESKPAQKRKMCFCGKVRPSFGLPGSKTATWCKDCPQKDTQAVDVVSRRCACGKSQPSLGLPGSKRRMWCKDCPQKPSNAMSTNCKRCVCGKHIPTFGLLGSKTAIWCKDCPQKSINAVDVNRARCVCSKRRPTFGLPGSNRAIWCKDCPEKDIKAVNLTAKRCMCGKAQPSFGLANSNTSIWCKECPEKPGNAIDVKHKRCVCGKRNPSFGLPGSNTAIWCKDCPQKDLRAVDVINKRCACGQGRATLGVSGSKRAIWCKNCVQKDIHAVDVRTRRCACGKSQPTFGFPGDKTAMWCKDCPQKELHAVDVVNKRCACGKRSPSFGLPGSKIRLWCKDCPEKNMNAVDVICRRCACGKPSSYGAVGSCATHCGACKSRGMSREPRKRCLVKRCSNLAIFGKSTRLHCEDHRQDDERNLVERSCVACGLFNVLNENGHCEYCDPQKFQSFVQRKELHIRDVLDANGFTDYKHNKVPNGVECGRERPDFEFELFTHVVIVEVDERQHSGYSCLCEQIRMVNVSQTFGGKPVFWIRYNPDEFKLKDGTKSTISNNKREIHLIEWLKYAHTHVPTAYLEVIYLFYDGCNERAAAEDIQNIITWEKD